jgi:hypothetical protein
MLAVTDPVAACEFVEQRTVQATRRMEVGVLDHGALTQSGVAEPSGETLVVARGYLVVEQQAEPVLAREVGGGGIALHLEECIGHGGHAEAAQAFGQRVDQHRFSFQW